MQAGYR